ncbi:hypothetical protein [Streptococcus anginosus]|uniref:hypothetical protein n=1 Tax=Streptococcus anginosus TaxID=1328 RepID=UPI003564B7AC
MKTIKMVERKNEAHEEYKARINAKIKELGEYYVTQSSFDNSLAIGNKSYIVLYYYTFAELLKHKAEHLFGDVYRYENKIYKILQQNGKLPQDFPVVEITAIIITLTIAFGFYRLEKKNKELQQQINQLYEYNEKLDYHVSGLLEK